MKEAVIEKDRRRNKTHELWQGTFDVKECRTENFILQKLNYIHNNPCTGKWKLAEKPYEYLHSSARFYDGDKNGYKVKDYLEVLAELSTGMKCSLICYEESRTTLPNARCWRGDSSAKENEPCWPSCLGIRVCVYLVLCAAQAFVLKPKTIIMQRRTFIKNSTLTVISVSAFGALNWNGKNFEGDTPTTTDILGPFYRPGAPIRTNLRLPGSKGTPIVLKGKIFKEDGKTPVNNAFVEIWHCNEAEEYDNTSDDYNYRGGQKTKTDGTYEFKSILPVPYKARPTDESSWRPAHIHMRVSVPNQQDLITQIYFKGGKYVETDKWASAPQAINRILPIRKNNSGESEIIFNVVMSKEIPLDKKVYDKITGLYDVGDNNSIEFSKSDDLLLMKQNGQLWASLKYIGNNTFVGGIGYPKASFDLQKDGSVKVVVETEIPSLTTYTGIKYLKY